MVLPRVPRQLKIKAHYDVQRRIERLLVVTNYGLHQNRDAVLCEVLDTP